MFFAHIAFAFVSKVCLKVSEVSPSSRYWYIPRIKNNLAINYRLKVDIRPFYTIF